MINVMHDLLDSKRKNYQAILDAIHHKESISEDIANEIQRLKYELVKTSGEMATLDQLIQIANNDNESKDSNAQQAPKNNEDNIAQP